MRFARLAAVAATLSLLAGCGVDRGSASLELRDLGFTNISIQEGVVLFECGRDYVGSQFTATAPNGRQVRGMVCQSLFGVLMFRFS